MTLAERIVRDVYSHVLLQKRCLCAECRAAMVTHVEGLLEFGLALPDIHGGVELPGPPEYRADTREPQCPG